MNRYYPLAILTALVASPFYFTQQASAQTPIFYSQARASVVLIENTLGVRQGTGFIVNGENNTYYVLTAGHVANKGQLQIRTDSGEVRLVDAIRPLPGADLALLQFRSTNPQPIARLANDANGVPAQSRIFILGYPSGGLGTSPEIPGGNVTSRQPSIFHNVQTREGMSGSPVLTENGEVVGIHIGVSSSGFGEAIPIEKYKELAPRFFTQEARDNLAAGNFDQAIASLAQVSGLVGSGNAEVSVVRAYAYFGNRDLDRARNEIRLIGNSNADAALLLGAIDYLQRNFSGAVSNLNRAKELDPSRNIWGYALAILGLSYAENPSSVVNANESATLAIRSLSSDDSFGYLARSCVRTKTKETDGASSDLANANAPERQRPPQNVLLGVINSRLQEAIRNNCLLQSPNPNPNPTPPPRIDGRYKSSTPTQLGEESTGLAVSKNSRFVATGLRDGTVAIYDIQTRNKVASFSTGQERDDISSIAFSPNERDIAITSTSGIVKVFNIQSQQEQYSNPNAGIRPLVVFNDNGNFLFIGSGSGTLRMVNMRSRQIQASESNAHNLGVTSLTLSPDGRFLATGGGDGVIKLWSTSDLTPVDSYQAHQGAVISLAFSPDGSQIINIGDKAVKSCNLQSKSCSNIASTRDNLNSLAVASNGHIAFSEVSFLIRPDNPIFLQDSRNGQSLGTLLGHRDRIVALAYTPDSRYLISGSSDGTMIIWEVQ